VHPKVAASILENKESSLVVMGGGIGGGDLGMQAAPDFEFEQD